MVPQGVGVDDAADFPTISDPVAQRVGSRKYVGFIFFEPKTVSALSCLPGEADPILKLSLVQKRPSFCLQEP